MFVNKVLDNIVILFEESKFTALASITGMPAVVTGGVQLVGAAFSDRALLDIAAVFEKEVK